MARAARRRAAHNDGLRLALLRLRELEPALDACLPEHSIHRPRLRLGPVVALDRGPEQVRAAVGHAVQCRLCALDELDGQHGDRAAHRAPVRLRVDAPERLARLLVAG
eukprot:3351195-Prymnesium_polylepis.1